MEYLILCKSEINFHKNFHNSDVNVLIRLSTTAVGEHP